MMNYGQELTKVDKIERGTRPRMMNYGQELTKDDELGLGTH